MVSFTVILKSFQSLVALVMSSPIFFEDRFEVDLGGQGRHGSDFPIGAPQVDDFDLIGIKLQ